MSPAGRDPYLYPGTNVLINNGNIRDQAELSRFEADAVFFAHAGMKAHPLAGPFDIRRLQETHRRIFGCVYPWAGEIRKDIGLMAKNRSGFVVSYGPAQHVPGALAAVFVALKAENDLHGLDAGANRAVGRRSAASLPCARSGRDARRSLRADGDRRPRSARPRMNEPG